MLMTEAKQPAPPPASRELMPYPEIDEHLLDQLVVILVQGSNVFGDKVYSYVEMTMAKMREMAERIGNNQNFKPSDFGRVLAAGRGDPPEDVREEMAREHKLVDVPGAAAPSAPPKAVAPRFPSFPANDGDAADDE